MTFIRLCVGLVSVPFVYVYSSLRVCVTLTLITRFYLARLCLVLLVED